MSVFHTKVHEKADHLAISAIVRMPHCDYYPRVIDTKLAGRLAKVDLLQTGWPYVEPLLAIYRKANYRVGVNMKVAIAELEAVPVSRNSVQYTMEKLFDEKDRHPFYEFMKRLHSGNISVPAVFEWRGTRYYSREDSMNIACSFWEAIYANVNAREAKLSQVGNVLPITEDTVYFGQAIIDSSHNDFTPESEQFNDFYERARSKLAIKKSVGTNCVSDYCLRDRNNKYWKFLEPDRISTSSAKTSDSIVNDPFVIAQWILKNMDRCNSLMHRFLLAHLGDHAYGWRLNIRVYEFARNVFLGDIKIPKHLMEGKLVLLNKTSSDISSIKDTRQITVLNWAA